MDKSIGKVERKSFVTFKFPYISEACETVSLNADCVKMYFVFEFRICFASSSERKQQKEYNLEIKSRRDRYMNRCCINTPNEPPR